MFCVPEISSNNNIVELPNDQGLEWAPAFKKYPAKESEARPFGKKQNKYSVRKRAETRQQDTKQSYKKEVLSMPTQYKKRGRSGRCYRPNGWRR